MKGINKTLLLHRILPLKIKLYIDKKIYHAFQFTYKQKKVDSGRMIPTIFFRYDISPMKMKYTKYYPGHFDGLINICAIFVLISNH